MGNPSPKPAPISIDQIYSDLYAILSDDWNPPSKDLTNCTWGQVGAEQNQNVDDIQNILEQLCEQYAAEGYSISIDQIYCSNLKSPNLNTKISMAVDNIFDTLNPC